MRTAYRGLCYVIVAGVVLQLASIGLAGFTTANDADDGVAIDAAYSNLGQDFHAVAGPAIGVVAILLVIVSLLTNVPRGRMLAGAILGLVVLQVVLAVVSFGLPAIGLLHALNGMAIAAVASTAGRQAVQQSSAATAAATSG